MKNKKKLININRYRYIINILGEVCWGFKIENFKKKIGAELEIVEKLLESLIRKEREGISEVYLTDSDIEIIKKSLIEVSREIEEWEFQTRFGVTLDEIKENPIFH